MNNSDAGQILDGVLLGDGGLAKTTLGKSSYFKLEQVGTDHMDWLNFVKGAIVTLGVVPSKNHPRFLKGVSKGKEYIYSRLSSQSSPLLEYQYKRWYKEGRKVVPTDLLMTPIVLAHWFMGDGSSVWKQLRYVNVTFSTQSFLPEEQSLLCSLIQQLGIRTGKPTAYGNIIISGVGSVNDFMDIVEPLILPSFRCKIKRPMYVGGGKRWA